MANNPIQPSDIAKKGLFDDLGKSAESADKILESLDETVNLLAKDFLKLDKTLDEITPENIEKLNSVLVSSNKLREQSVKIEKAQQDQAIKNQKILQEEIKSQKELEKAIREEIKTEREKLKLEKELQEQIKKTNKEREERKKRLTETEKIQQRINKAQTEEGKELAKLRAELTKVNKANREAAKSLIEQKDGYQELTGRVNEAQKEFKRLAAEQGLNSEETERARKEFEKLDKELREINEAAKDGRRDVGRYKQQVGELADELKGAANQAGGFGDVISAVTSPVGLASAGVGALGAAFNATEAGGNKVDDVLSQVKGGFNAVTASAGGFVSGLLEGESVSESYANNVEGVTERIKEQSQANLEATQQSRQNRKDLRLESEALAVLRGEYELLQQQAGDATTTQEAQNSAVISSQAKAVEIAEQELVVIQKQIDAIDLQIKAREGLNNEDLLDERQEFINEQIELEGTLNAEIAALGQERRQIEQDQWEQRLDFLFDASDRQKSITERQLQNDKIATDERIAEFERLRVSLLSTYAQIEREFQQASGQALNLADFANLEATAQAELLETLNLSEIERNRLREAVVEYLAVLQDLDDTQEELNEVEADGLELQQTIALQREKLADVNIDLEKKLRDQRKENLKQEIADLEEGSLERLRKEKELNDILLKQQAEDQKIFLEQQKEFDEEEIEQQKEFDEEVIEQDEDTNEERTDNLKQSLDQTLDLLDDFYSERSKRRVDAIDAEIKAEETAQDKLRASAEAGTKEADESIALSEKREQEAIKRREDELKKQQRIELGIAAAKIAAAKAEAGDENAALSTIPEMLALVSTLESFKEGTENTGRVNKPLDSDGGRLAVIHNDERILDKEKNDKIRKVFGYDISNEDLTNIVTGDIMKASDNIELSKNVISYDNVLVLKELKNVRKELKEARNNPVVYKNDYNQLEKMMVDVVKTQNKVTKKITIPKRVLR